MVSFLFWFSESESTLLLVKFDFTKVRLVSWKAIFRQGSKMLSFGGQAREEDLVNFHVKYFGLFLKYFWCRARARVVFWKTPVVEKA